MIAYKVFYVMDGKLFPWYHKNRRTFQSYDLGYVILRADDCGPFACFKTIREAENFTNVYAWDVVLYRVKIKKSRRRSLWIGTEKCSFLLPPGSILADEFEILERVK